MNSTDLRRWLGGDAAELVRIVPAKHGGNVSRLGLRDGVVRWRARIDRRRVAALVRRRLLLGLLLAVMIELIAAAAGASARGLWLIPVAAITLTTIAIALRHRVGPLEATLLLDRQLGLSERLTTALELTSSPGSSGPFGALLRGEADAAIDDSLAHSRASDPSAPREWMGVLLACLLVLGAVALGGTGSGARSTGSGRTTASARPGGASPPTPTKAQKTTDARPTSTSLARTQTVSKVPKPIGKSEAASHGSESKSGAGANERAGATGAGALARRGATSSGPASERGATGAGKAGATAAAGTSKPGAAAKGHEAAGTPMGAARTHPISGGAAHAGSKQSSTSADAGRKAGRTTGAGTTRGSKGAGTARGRTSAPAEHLAKRKATSTAALPIQSGYEAGHGEHSSQGSGEGKAGAASKQPQGEVAATGEGPSAASFAFIPFAPAGVSSSEAPLLLGYFGPFAALSGLSW